jgi:hypothetical protein
MIFTTRHGESFDTQKDLTAPERHILQKLFFWKSMAVSVEQFREKKAEALRKGWNNSGPVSESTAMSKITQDLEEKVLLRLRMEKDS